MTRSEKSIAAQVERILDEEFVRPKEIEDVFVYEFRGQPASRRPIWTLIGRVVRRKRFWLAVLFLMTLAVAFHLRHIGVLSPENLLGILKAHPYWAPAVFFIVYSVMVVALLPTLPLNLAAGFLWGGFNGTLISIVSACFGAAVSFLLTRYISASLVPVRFNNKRWRWLRLKVARSDVQVLAFTRLNPVFPFGPLNYFFGLTSVRFSRYLWTTAAFIAPPSAMFSYLGSSIGGVVMDAGSEAILKNVMIFSSILTVSVLIRLLVRHLSGRKGGRLMISELLKGKFK